MKRDKLFLIVLGVAAFLIVAFGVAAVVLALSSEHQDSAVTARVISAFQAMFGSTIAFAVGYLVGKNGNGH